MIWQRRGHLTTTPTPTGRDRRSTGDRGVALVEFALVFPVLMVLIVGMVTAGLALGQKNAVENAAREASRFGATLPVESTTNDWLDAVSAAAISAATGELDDGVSGREICVALVGTSTDGIKTIDSAGVATYGSSGNCPAMSCPTTVPCVQVRLERDGEIEAIFVRHDFSLTGSSVSVYERES